MFQCSCSRPLYHQPRFPPPPLWLAALDAVHPCCGRPGLVCWLAQVLPCSSPAGSCSVCSRPDNMIKLQRLDHGRHPAPRPKRGSCLFGFGSRRFRVQSESPGNFAGVVTVAKQTPDLTKSKAIKTTFGSRIALPGSVPSGSRASQLPWRTISSLRHEPRAQLATTGRRETPISHALSLLPSAMPQSFAPGRLDCGKAD